MKKYSDGLDHFKDILVNMANIYAAKNADYGNSFEDSCNEFGIVAAIVRMNDKMNRLKTLSKKENKVKDESILDTLTDLANYAILTRMWLEDNPKQKEEESLKETTMVVETPQKEETKAVFKTCIKGFNLDDY